MKELTMRNTVDEIKKALNEMSVNKVVKADKNLYSRLAYTAKSMKGGEKVKKADLLDLLKDCNVCITAYAEEQAKQKESKKRQKATPKGEASTKKVPKRKTEQPAKETPKEEPEKKVETKKETAKKPEPKGFSFPTSFEDDDYSYTASDMAEISTMRKALEDDKEVVVATKWTKEDLKQYDYASGQVKKPKSFKNDMDLLTVLYVGDRIDLFYAVSMYTEAVYVFVGKSLKPTKEGHRIDEGLSYAVYLAEEK